MANSSFVKIKLGANAVHGVKVPVSVPVVAKPADERFAILDVVQFQGNNPDGLVVTAEAHAKMLAETDLQAKIDAGLVVVEIVTDPIGE